MPPREKRYVIPSEWLGQLNTWSAHQLGLLTDACNDQGVNPADMPKVIAARDTMRADAAAELVTLDPTIMVRHQETLRLRKRRTELLALLGKPF